MKKYLIIGIILLSSMGIIYNDYIFGDKEFLIPDYLKQGVPVNRFIEREQEKTGKEHPLWFTDIFGGMPFHASGTHPIRINLEGFVRFFIPDSIFVDTIHGRFTFHLLLIFVFAFILLKFSYGLTFLPACTGAFAYAFTSHIIGTEHINRLSAFTYIPVIFMGAREIFNKRRAMGFLLLALGIGFSFNSYHQQISYYTMMFIGVYILWELVFKFKNKEKVDFALIGILAAGLAVGFLVGLHAFWPLKEYLPFSARGAGMSEAERYQWVTNWSFSPRSMLTFIFPSFEGFSIRAPHIVNGAKTLVPTYWGPMPFTDFPHYIGIVVVFLAGLGLKNFKTNKNVAFLGVSALFFLLISFGREFPLVYNLFYYHFPLFDSFRGPVKILIILQFNIAVLAGFGLEYLMHSTERDFIKKYFKYVSIGAGAFLLIFVVFSSGIESFMHGLYEASGKGGNQQINQIRFEMLTSDIIKFFFVIAILIGVYAMYAKKIINVKMMAAIIMVLAVADLVHTGTRIVNPEHVEGTIERWYESRRDDIVKYMLNDADHFRVFPVDNFSENKFGYWGIQTIGGYHAAKMAGMQRFIDNNLLFNSSVYSMLNVKYLMSKHDLRNIFPDLQHVLSSRGVHLFENLRNPGRVFFTDTFRVLNDEKGEIEELSRSDFDFRKDAFVDKKPDEHFANNLDATNSSYTIKHYANNKIEIDVNTSGNVLMVLSEMYYPKGWSVYVNGEETQIYRVNHILRGVFLESGESSVVFKFRPFSFYFSYRMSLVTAFLLSTMFLIFILHKKNYFSAVVSFLKKGK